MKKMIFISRHTPTATQEELSAKAGFNLVHVGDVDAFSSSLPEEILALTKKHNATGVACVHPIIALEAVGIMSNQQESCWFKESLAVGMFSNENRGGEFVATSLVVMTMNYAMEENCHSSFTRKVIR